MRRNGARAIKPRGAFDRTLMLVAQERIWENVPAAVKYVAEVMLDAERPDSVRLKAAGMLLERSIPTLQSQRVVVDTVRAGEVDWASIYREQLEASRPKAEQGGEVADARIH